LENILHARLFVLDKAGMRLSGGGSIPLVEYRYVFPGFPTKVEGRDALMALYSGYGDSTILHSGDALVVHRSQDPRVLILEYEVHGKKILTGKSYDNRFISVVTIEDRKIVHWRDYMDSLAAFTAETGTRA
jgi:uncharacterized protein